MVGGNALVRKAIIITDRQQNDESILKYLIFYICPICIWNYLMIHGTVVFKPQLLFHGCLKLVRIFLKEKDTFFISIHYFTCDGRTSASENYTGT